MRLNISILYRGALSSCNYDCSYCPFAKHWESADELRTDREGLERFCAWVASRRNDRVAVFFTPWGEALVRSWYRDVIVELSRLPHVPKVAVQTNLSCSLDWIQDAQADRLGLWCTYHPGQVPRATFVQQCHRLSDLGVRFSVGCVGLREHLTEIEALRHELPQGTYVWINAYRDEPDYYDQSLLDALETIDPLFPLNHAQHDSRGRACRTGHSVITVDSAGDMRRCHFVKDVIGNLYTLDLDNALTPSPCPKATCDCHIGYVHLDYLGLDRVFGEGILERIPETIG